MTETALNILSGLLLPWAALWVRLISMSALPKIWKRRLMATLVFCGALLSLRLILMAVVFRSYLSHYSPPIRLALSLVSALFTGAAALMAYQNWPRD